mmetsp:Transcript_11704/g.29641  ORF Transcript_11704/g.29641 Transcript_11704/m.29641 type:complete len:487 (-) Transcript_11704:1212-2672(-)|eukprot:CAMPEP_0116086784 /NCGR_PEP_ID=MMETSP0327-20121206/5033_1 /TAXON_ID=44447 /ORGANISM="Pseudo-nitzschia delicatissima, Strain B596" /LENGTH=486 /DNA_ID=CAMNT_0003577845 /DNA_START=149 /DNA_END=1609 /DNA_ORIENTATION=+
MGVDIVESTKESSCRSRGRSTRSKSPFKPLASEDSLCNSDTSRSISVHDDEENWCSFKMDDLSKRSQTMNSIASTATLTSHESSSHLNTSFSNSKWSPAPERRGSHKTPRKSPKYKNLLSNHSESEQIGSLPLTTPSGQPVENGIIKSTRRFSGMDGPPTDAICKDGKASYYQPSKASLHDSNQNQPSKKPQRIRARSKGPLLRRKSHGEVKAASQRSERTTEASSEHGKRSKSCEPKPPSKTKTKASPSLRSRKKPSSLKLTETQVTTTDNAFHESWPRPNKDTERQAQRNRQTEKTKVTEKGKRKTKSPKIKFRKVGKDENTTSDINNVITFFEDMAVHKAEIQSSSAPRTRGLGKKSSSARFVTRRSKNPASSGLGNSSEHGKRRDEPISETSNKNRQRRSSAPAKALAAFHQYKQVIGGPEFEKLDDEPSAEPPLQPHEKIMLDVSELAALEIIRLGKDNSLKLDVFDLMNHLKRQQSRQKQ